MSGEHTDVEAKIVCAHCGLPGSDSDIFQELCCNKLVGHVRCIAEKKKIDNKTIKCLNCMVADLAKPRTRRRRVLKLTCCGKASIAIPLLIMMVISSYLLPPLLGQWFLKIPYGKVPMSFFSFDTYFMFGLEASTFLCMWFGWTLCVCCGRGFLDACCCCCCFKSEEIDVKIQ
jgi:hypothetical protein